MADLPLETVPKETDGSRRWYNNPSRSRARTWARARGRIHTIGDIPSQVKDIRRTPAAGQVIVRCRGIEEIISNRDIVERHICLLRIFQSVEHRVRKAYAPFPLILQVLVDDCGRACPQRCCPAGAAYFDPGVVRVTA